MGQIDCYEWKAKRIHGCNCRYCTGSFNAVMAFDYVTMGPSRDLADGEIQIYMPRTNGVVRTYITKPGCILKSATFAGTSDPLVNTNNSKAWVPTVERATKSTGFNCVTCNERNDYAEANTPTGSYICYRCR